MKAFRYTLQTIISIGLVLSIAACSGDVDYTPPSSSNEMAITHYSFGKMVIDGTDNENDLSITPEGKVIGWWFDYDSHIIEVKNFGNLITDEVKTLIIGTGYRGAASLSNQAIELIDQIKAKGIQVHVLSTGPAVKLFNTLSKKGLLAFFHLNC